MDALTVALFGEGRSAFPGRDAARRAEQWLDGFVEANRKAICSHEQVVLVLDSARAKDIDEAAIIFNVLASIGGVPKSVPLGTLAVILARRSLVRICRDT
jgi:hypothetical protein